MPVLTRRRLVALTPTLGTGIVWFLAIALSAWIAAGWYWRIKSPSTPGLPPAISSDAVSIARGLAARHFFGEIVQQQAAVVASRYTLIGVSANLRDGSGFAIVKIDDQAPAPFIVGEEVQPGVIFSRALPDAIELKRGETIERVALAETYTASATPAPIAMGMPGQTLQPPPGINSPPPSSPGLAPPGYTPRGNAAQFNSANAPQRVVRSPGAGMEPYPGSSGIAAPPPSPDSPQQSASGQ